MSKTVDAEIIFFLLFLNPDFEYFLNPKPKSRPGKNITNLNELIFYLLNIDELQNRRRFVVVTG